MRYKAADGTQLRDEGGGLLEGPAERGLPLRLRGRRTGVKRPLVAGSELLQGKLSIMDDEEGWVLDRHSKAGKAVAKLINRFQRNGRLDEDIKLHQENGVYNAYMKLPKAKARGLRVLAHRTGVRILGKMRVPMIRRAVTKIAID